VGKPHRAARHHPGSHLHPESPGGDSRIRMLFHETLHLIGSRAPALRRVWLVDPKTRSVDAPQGNPPRYCCDCYGRRTIFSRVGSVEIPKFPVRESTSPTETPRPLTEVSIP
jgi:hypothetical protein